MPPDRVASQPSDKDHPLVSPFARGKLGDFFVEGTVPDV